jgi:hypothetical protein
MRPLLAFALLLATPARLAAQRMGFAPHFSGRSSGSHGEHFRNFGYPRAGYYPLGLFDPFYTDYLDAGYPVASEPPVIVVQQPQVAAAAEPPAAPRQPLMIELQGDRYVQMSGDQRSGAQMIDSPSESPASLQSSRSSHAPKPASPVVLIFRDGHSQEVSAYTIADGVLYAASDYASTGEWTQAIELASLDVLETVATNSSRGLRFQLPTAPNEVMVGP